MNAKTFEIRDSGTFIPVLAVQLEPSCPEDRYLLARSGYGLTRESQREYVQLVEINGGHGRSECDHFAWTGSRTMHVAHRFIRENFDSLDSGAIVDVEFILGESAVPATSERELL